MERNQGFVPRAKTEQSPCWWSRLPAGGAEPWVSFRPVNRLRLHSNPQPQFPHVELGRQPRSKLRQIGLRGRIPRSWHGRDCRKRVHGAEPGARAVDCLHQIWLCGCEIACLTSPETRTTAAFQQSGSRRQSTSRILMHFTAAICTRLALVDHFSGHGGNARASELEECENSPA